MGVVVRMSEFFLDPPLETPDVQNGNNGPHARIHFISFCLHFSSRKDLLLR